MQINRNIVPHQEIDNILFILSQCHPEAFVSSQNNENLCDEMQYLRWFPLNYVEVFGECIDFILLSTKGGDNVYAGCDWHIDGDEKETTVLLYLQGDSNKGGEFCTETETVKFQSGTMLVLPSKDLHKVNNYYGEENRIALKWKFR